MHRESPHFVLYALLTGLGLIAGIAALKLLKDPPRRQRIRVMALLPSLVVGAMIGSKVPVIISYGWHQEFLWTGKSYFGALLGAFLAINAYKAFRRQRGAFGDRFVIPLCISAGIGKIGCFLNGCCGGTGTAWVLGVGTAGAGVHPVQLYESAFNFACAGLFFYLARRDTPPGSHFPLYMLLYMSFRFVVEFIRVEPRFALNITVYQWMAILFLPVFSIILYRRVSYAA